MVKAKTITLNKLLKEVREAKLPFLFDEENSMIIVWKTEDERGNEYETAHLHRAFNVKSDGKLVELDIKPMIEEIAEYLKEYVPVKAFLKDVLTTKPPSIRSRSFFPRWRWWAVGFTAEGSFRRPLTS